MLNDREVRQIVTALIACDRMNIGGVDYAPLRNVFNIIATHAEKPVNIIINSERNVEIQERT
jgi:hypothetical protein